jgi:transcriptional regulator with XRE-family HTH domain
MTDRFGPELRRLRTERGLSLGKLAELVPCNRGYVGQLEHGDRHPSATLARKLDDVLQAGGELVALARSDAQAPMPTSPQPDDEFDAFELARRATASDVSNTTLAGLELAVDRLAVAYQGTTPVALLLDVRRHLHYVGQLIDKRATLEQRRRLLIVGGWLSLLAGTVHIDLHQRAPAGARLAAAESLAEHTDNREIAAWCLETRAWDALTEGRFKLAADLSQAAQRIAPQDGSAFIQATAQEGRAWARLGETRAARDAMSRVERLASPLPMPDQPEHHYRYDPAKQHAYTATTLSWITDPAAETIAREVLARLESARDGGPRPRRTATARLDLALTLLRVGNLDEAARQAITAMSSGRIVPSSAWRVAEVLTAVEAAELNDAIDLRERYEATFGKAATT